MPNMPNMLPRRALSTGRFVAGQLVPGAERRPVVRRQRDRRARHRPLHAGGVRGDRPHAPADADHPHPRGASGRWDDRAVLWSHPAFANRHVVARNDAEVVRLSLAVANCDGSRPRASPTSRSPSGTRSIPREAELAHELDRFGRDVHRHRLFLKLNRELAMDPVNQKSYPR